MKNLCLIILFFCQLSYGQRVTELQSTVVNTRTDGVINLYPEDQAEDDGIPAVFQGEAIVYHPNFTNINDEIVDIVNEYNSSIMSYLSIDSVSSAASGDTINIYLDNDIARLGKIYFNYAVNDAIQLFDTLIISDDIIKGVTTNNFADTDVLDLNASLSNVQDLDSTYLQEIADISINNYNDFKYDTNDWVDTMIIDYVDIRNTHFQPYWQRNVVALLKEWLSPDYTMPNDSANYYDRQGPNGLDQDSADWFNVFGTRNTGAITTHTVTKSGETLWWNFGDTAYIQNDIPTHTIIDSCNYMLVSSDDGWSGITYYDIYGNDRLTDNMPLLNLPNVIRFRYQDCGFTGEMPKHIIPSNTNTFFFNTNDFYDTIPDIYAPTTYWGALTCGFEWAENGGYSHITTNLGTDHYQNNFFTETAVDSVLGAHRLYWVDENNIPTKNLIIYLDGTNEAPGTTGDGYIIEIQTHFTNNGRTATINTN